MNSEFKILTDWLFFEQSLVVDGENCQIAEIEYFKSPDPYTNESPINITSRKIHFSNNRVNITIGKAPNTFGYLIIRSIKIANKFIETPTKVLEYVLDRTGYNLDSILDISDTKLKLVPFKYSKSHIYIGPRVNLNLNKERSVNGIWMNNILSNLRATCYPSKIKVEKWMLVVTARIQGIPDDTINKDFKLHIGILSKWISYYYRGNDLTLDIILDSKSTSLDTKENRLAFLRTFVLKNQ